MYCIRCNGYGSLYIKGDNDFECPDCHGTGEQTSQLTISEARDICRCWGYGGNVTDRLHEEALGVLKALEPVIEYILVSSEEDDREFEEAMAERQWQREYEESKLSER